METSQISLEFGILKLDFLFRIQNSKDADLEFSVVIKQTVKSKEKLRSLTALPVAPRFMLA